MDLIKDIAEICKDDVEHQIEIKFDQFGVNVYLYYDPENNYKDNCIIPIRYETLESFAYIPHDEYVEKYKLNDYGIDVAEINLVAAIMNYLQAHGKEIEDMCDGLSISSREENK